MNPQNYSSIFSVSHAIPKLLAPFRFAIPCRELNRISGVGDDSLRSHIYGSDGMKDIEFIQL